MTEKMKTVCVGRFLVDVPAQSETSLSHEMIDGFRISMVDETEAEFRDRLLRREANIIGGGPSPDGGGRGGMVQARNIRIPSTIGRIFIYGRNRGYLMQRGERVYLDSVSVEAHMHIDGYSFSLSAESTDEAGASAAEALLAQLRLRGENEIPSGPGFCIGRAIFVEPLPLHKTEHVTLHVGFVDHPDVALAFASMPGGGTDPNLLERSAKTDAEESQEEGLRVSKLRRGKRDINGLSGEEVLERMRELNFSTTYSFMWETPGLDDDPLHPFVSLELLGGISPWPGGKPVDTSLHEDAMVALWDRISSSIRPRPFGPAPAPATPPEPPQPRLGAVSIAGDTCPQSGWWKCREGGPGVDVQGGAVQWVRKGDRMPQALLLPQQSLWQKLRGIRASIEPDHPTTWELVDKRLRPRTPTVVALAQPGQAVAIDTDTVAEGARQIAVGSHARTGEICPASGWWRCEESHALDETRWFARGSTLPAATFQVPTGMFGRSSGPDIIQRRSTWRLVRHAEAEGVALVAAAVQKAQRGSPST